MKYIKRTLVICLSILLIFGIVGCSNDTKGSNNNAEQITFDGTNIPITIKNTSSGKSTYISPELVAKDLKNIGISEFTYVEWETEKVLEFLVAANSKGVCSPKMKIPQMRLVIGGINDTDKEIKFEDARVFFLESTDSSMLEICGVSVGMTKEDVVSKYGPPTVEGTHEEGGSFEYNLLTHKGENYVLAIMHDVNFKVTQISLNIGNQPLFDE